ncbi:unnamed protein product [Clonostachys rosea]|uniref:Lysine-specific metallo-endopeptidase domain-containing protein n=1 Tax=Bionectria ochroleuca TaxID=29856 RepID=A0ABY6TQD2_BIOOC|nr:unnamed protein product [Clonostachys rosea]
MRGIFGLLFTTLALGHVVPYGLDADNTPALLERQVQPVRLTSVKVAPIRTSEYPFASGECDNGQVVKLQAAIIEARELLSTAGDLLKNKGSQFTDTYEEWFGPDKTPCFTCSKVSESIRKHNFEAPHRDLGLPFERIGQTLSPNQLDPRALTFTCWPIGEDHCQARFIAGTINPGLHPGSGLDFAGTLIGLCPRFFDSPDLQTVIQQFQGSNQHQTENSAGLTLVHEMQHVLATTGTKRNCTDVIVGNAVAYDTERCRGLSNEDKIKNAQNMAFFALDVRANQGRG